LRLVSEEKLPWRAMEDDMLAPAAIMPTISELAVKRSPSGRTKCSFSSLIRTK
jgi:hypothetical protein